MDRSALPAATSQYGVPDEITRKLGERVPLEMQPGSILRLTRRGQFALRVLDRLP
jgi:hypothetical protein